MSAALHALCDNGICAAALHQLRHRDTRHDRDNLHASRLPHLHVFRWIARTCCDHFDALVHNHLRDGICLWIHQHDVHAKRLTGHFLYLLNLLSDKLCGRPAGTDDSQSSGF